MDDSMKKKQERVGLFGGTFDPIHLGHINLALSLLEAHQLDRVIFCPAAVSPFKDAAPPKASKEERKEMVSIAIKKITPFSLLESELERKGLSYTIDTILDVLAIAKSKDEELDLFLLLGEDALAHFHLWKDVEEILAKVKPLVGARSVDQKISFPREMSASIEKALREGITDIPILDISSTMIRKRLGEGKYCGHLVPPDVLSFIHTHKLYLT